MITTGLIKKYVAVQGELAEGPFVDGDKTKLDTLDKINTIADKATAYALTGVVAGTVYETTDTGQILERTTRSEFAWGGDWYVTGGTYQENGAGTVKSIADKLAWVSDVTVASFGNIIAPATLLVGTNLSGFGGFYITSDSSLYIGGTANKWGIGEQIYTGNALFESVEDASTVHPADATWVAVEDGVTIPTFIKVEPTSWKHDGVILVADNDEKQLLTSLPDTQQVEVVGEGGRLERFNGDNAGILTSFNISDAGSPYDGYGTTTAAGLYHWDAANNRFASAFNLGVLHISHNGTNWILENDGDLGFTAPASAASVHPADVVGAWTINGAAPWWTGTIDGVDNTQLPEATESNWSAIKNTVYLTVNDAAANGGFDVNGVTVANGATQGIGWVPVAGYISSNINPTVSTVHLRVDNVNGISAWANSQAGKKSYATRTLNELTLPSIFPSGALVTLLTTSQ